MAALRNRLQLLLRDPALNPAAVGCVAALAALVFAFISIFFYARRAGVDSKASVPILTSAKTAPSETDDKLPDPDPMPPFDLATKKVCLRDIRFSIYFHRRGSF